MRVELIDYKLAGPKTPKRYNGITVIKGEEGPPAEDDPFRVSESNGGPVPDEYVPRVIPCFKLVHNSVRVCIS